MPSSLSRIAFPKPARAVGGSTIMHRVTPGSDDRDHGGSRGEAVRATWARRSPSALVALVVAVWSLRLWDWRVGTPFGLNGDSTFVAMQLRDISDHGWYWNNPDLAFPFGQNGSMFPELNVVHVLAVKALGIFAEQPVHARRRLLRPLLPARRAHHVRPRAQPGTEPVGRASSPGSSSPAHRATRSASATCG